MPSPTTKEVAQVAVATPLRETNELSAVEAAPRRPFIARFSGGHVIFIVAGLIAAVFTFTALKLAQDTVSVAVASQTIASGEPIEASSVRFVEVGGDSAALDGLVSEAGFSARAGSVAVSRIGEGSLITTDSLRDPAGAESDLRAMSIPVDPAHAAGGSLTPGDRVDVIATGDVAAEFIATNVEVLSVDDAGGGLTDGPGSFAVTLSVTPDAALRLATASASGSIDILRATGATPIASGSDGGSTANGVS